MMLTKKSIESTRNLQEAKKKPKTKKKIKRQNNETDL